MNEDYYSWANTSLELGDAPDQSGAAPTFVWRTVGNPSTCSKCDDHAAQKLCKMYEKASHEDRCTWLIFEETCTWR